MTLHGAELESSFIEDKDVEHCYEVPYATGEIFLYDHEDGASQTDWENGSSSVSRTCLLHRTQPPCRVTSMQPDPYEGMITMSNSIHACILLLDSPPHA